MIDDDAIAEAGRTLAASASSPARVVLFGSRARGSGGPDSDLDFLVIEEEVGSKLDEMVRLRDALATLDVAIDVVVVSRAEAERARQRPGSLVRRALAEGRVLVEPRSRTGRAAPTQGSCCSGGSSLRMSGSRMPYGSHAA